ISTISAPPENFMPALISSMATGIAETRMPARPNQGFWGVAFMRELAWRARAPGARAEARSGVGEGQLGAELEGDPNGEDQTFERVLDGLAVAGAAQPEVDGRGRAAVEAVTRGVARQRRLDELGERDQARSRVEAEVCEEGGGRGRGVAQRCAIEQVELDDPAVRAGESERGEGEAKGSGGADGVELAGGEGLVVEAQRGRARTRGEHAQIG